MTTQRRNAEMVDLLGTDFQGRAEPNLAIASAISTWQSIPGIRGLWSASVVNESGSLMDCAFQNRTLTMGVGAAFAYSGLVPYVVYNGVNQYHYRADEAGLDITGNLSIGCWFYPLAVGAAQVLMAKANVNQIAYQLYLSAANNPTFLISANGVTFTQVVSTATVAANRWYFAMGRFTAGVDLTIVVYDGGYTTTVNAVAPPAAIFNSNANFEIARNMTGGYFNGRYWIGGMTPVPLIGAHIFNLCEQTRAAVGI